MRQQLSRQAGRQVTTATGQHHRFQHLALLALAGLAAQTAQGGIGAAAGLVNPGDQRVQQLGAQQLAMGQQDQVGGAELAQGRQASPRVSTASTISSSQPAAGARSAGASRVQPAGQAPSRR